MNGSTILKIDSFLIIFTHQSGRAEKEIYCIILRISLTAVYLIIGNPKEFLIEQIEKLQKAQKTKLDYPCLFDESNIKSIFGMLDPTAQGYITLQQYREGAFNNLRHM